MSRKVALSASAALVGCAFVALASPASAQQTNGPYVSFGAGAQWLVNPKTSTPAGTTTYRVLGEFPGHLDTSAVGVVALGYGFGNGFRIEGEIGYRESGITGANTGPAEGTISAWDGMANVLYDIYNRGWAVVPYVGVGVGAAEVRFHNVTIPNSAMTINDSDLQFAYQGIAGVSYAINQALKLDVGYRYFGTRDPTFTTSSGGSAKSMYRDNMLLVSLRWEFGARPPPAPPAAVTPPPAATAEPRPIPPAPQIQR